MKQILRPVPVSGTDRHDPKRPGWLSGPRRVICHNCYQDGHYDPDRTLKFREYPTIVLNYEKLNADENARVPVTSYNQDRQCAYMQIPIIVHTQRCEEDPRPLLLPRVYHTTPKRLE